MDSNLQEIISSEAISYLMPAEWTPHSRTWMAFATDDDESASRAWSNVANAIVQFEPVTMVVDPSHEYIARQLLDPRVDIVIKNLNDSWMRDIGPTFVFAVNQNNTLNAVDWVFNGWGAQHWAKWDNDAQIASFVADIAKVHILKSQMVNEGGGIQVNGKGAVIVTETVQLDLNRNPDMKKADVEKELQRTIGSTEVIWLKRGLARDYQDFGTRGHSDILAAFCNETTILYHDQQNPEHPDFIVSQEIKEVLEKTNYKLIPVPAPTIIYDEVGFVDYGYINHYVCNGAVIMCSFNDPQGDERAASILALAYPDRKIVQVDAREIYKRGGGIHCITQQQPKH